MFRFAHPEYLYLLLAAPALIALFAWALYDRRRRLARFGDPATVATLMPDASTGRMKLKFILFTTAVILVILAAARPQFGSKLREQKSEGIEMMLAVDISNSMLAEDFEPNRLERTKYAINKLFDGLEQDRVGVIVFAGDATVQLPITSDYRMAKAFAKRISPSMASVQGTSIGKALSLAEMSFSSGSGDSRVIILITDGEDHEPERPVPGHRAASPQRRLASSSLSRASTQRSPSGVLSFFQKGASVLSQSMMNSQASKASRRCALVTTTSTMCSPTAISPTRWMTVTPQTSQRALARSTMPASALSVIAG